MICRLRLSGTHLRSRLRLYEQKLHECVPDTLQALQDHIALDDLLFALEQAQRLGLLVLSADGPETSFAFAHNLVRQTLLASLSAPRRRLLHLREAEALARARPQACLSSRCAPAPPVRQAVISTEHQ
jgi:hypothetical protein